MVIAIDIPKVLVINPLIEVSPSVGQIIFSEYNVPVLVNQHNTKAMIYLYLPITMTLFEERSSIKYTLFLLTFGSSIQKP